MKLDPEGVEAAAYEIFDKSGFHSRKFCDRLATAALTAYFDHLKSEGLMTTEEREEALVIDGKAELVETTTYAILRTDKE